MVYQSYIPKMYISHLNAFLCQGDLVLCQGGCQVWEKGNHRWKFKAFSFRRRGPRTSSCTHWRRIGPHAKWCTSTGHHGDDCWKQGTPGCDSQGHPWMGVFFWVGLQVTIQSNKSNCKSIVEDLFLWKPTQGDNLCTQHEELHFHKQTSSYLFGVKPGYDLLNMGWIWIIAVWESSAFRKIYTFWAYHLRQKKSLLWQVQAAPKPKAASKPENKSEPVEPQTWTQKASSVLPTLLKDAADARTASIKLQTMEYAKELSGQLLDHAKKLEDLYQQLSTAVSQQAEDKKLRSLLKKATELEAFGAKAQAPAGAHVLKDIILVLETRSSWTMGRRTFTSSPICRLNHSHVMRSKSLCFWAPGT